GASRQPCRRQPRISSATCSRTCRKSGSNEADGRTPSNQGPGDSCPGSFLGRRRDAKDHAMKKSTLEGLVVALLLVSAGCSGSKSSGGKEEPDIGPDVEAVDSPTALFRAAIELENALADVLAEIKDKDSLSKAEPKIDMIERKGKILQA